MIKAYEIRFFQVGKTSKGGDAILIRLINEYNQPTIIVIDGGYAETGEKLKKYLENIGITTIDLVINTHPDIDHISGLIRLFEEDSITIKKLIMNRPWKDSNITADYFNDNRITDKSVNKRMTEAFKYAFNLEQVAIKKIGEKNIIHPVVGNTYFDCLTILSPSKTLYRKKLLESDKTPSSIENLSFKSFARKSKKLIRYIKGLMDWILEDTSPINETSIVTFLSLPDRNFLLTADAGRNNLTEALHYKSNREDLKFKSIEVMQLPHHGSRKNISPDLIRQINASDYIISCPPQGNNHPSRRMINMILETNPTAKIYTTLDCNSFVFRHNLKMNLKYQKPMEAYTEIEEI